MIVEDVVDYIKYGEFAQLSIAEKLDSTDVAIVEKAERQVLSYINLGLIELYKRFDLRTEETVISMLENQTIYTITPTNVAGAGGDDTLSALPGDFNHVLAAYDESGAEYNINKEEDALSVLTPSWNTVQIPNPVAGEAVFVMYNSSADRITWETSSAVTLAKQVELPPVMAEALLHYVGYRGHGARDGSVQAENNTHYNRFNASCARIKTLGMTTDAGNEQSSTLEDKGWA